MFPPMRRAGQQLTEQACREILARGSHGVLAVLTEEGYPYAVPLSYASSGDRIWFHCALQGKKTDALRRYDRVSFCVTDRDDVIPEEYTTAYRSVIVFGRIRFIEDPAGKQEALREIACKYWPQDTPEHRLEVIERNLYRTCLLELRIEHMTGKQGKALLKEGAAFPL